MTAPRELVNVSEAARRAGIPRSTVRTWIHGANPRLFPVGKDVDDTDLYDLAAVRSLAASTRRRRRRIK